MVQVFYSTLVLSGDPVDESRVDSHGYRRLSFAQPAGGGCAGPIARASSIHEGPVCLDRVSAEIGAIPPGPSRGRPDQMELLEALEFRARRLHIVHHRAAPDCDVFRS